MTTYQPGTGADLARLRLLVASISPYDVDGLEAKFQAVTANWSNRGLNLVSEAVDVPITMAPHPPVEQPKEIIPAYVQKPDPIRSDPAKRNRPGRDTPHANEIRARRAIQAACQHKWSKVGSTSLGKPRRYCRECKLTETVK